MSKRAMIANLFNVSSSSPTTPKTATPAATPAPCVSNGSRDDKGTMWLAGLGLPPLLLRAVNRFAKVLY